MDNPEKLSTVGTQDEENKALWPISISRGDNSSDMEKGMH